MMTHNFQSQICRVPSQEKEKEKEKKREKEREKERKKEREKERQKERENEDEKGKGNEVVIRHTWQLLYSQLLIQSKSHSRCAMGVCLAAA